MRLEKTLRRALVVSLGALSVPTTVWASEGADVPQVLPESRPAELQGAAAELASRADAGDPAAAYALAMRYLMGDTLERDRRKAREYLTRAAEGGDPRAMNVLGLMADPLWSDDPAMANVQTAVQWYRRAASQGYEASFNNLSELKKRGLVQTELEKPSPQASSAEAKPAIAQAPAMDGREMFKARSSALVEILGDGNYGSGVVLGVLRVSSTESVLRTADQESKVKYPFHSAEAAKDETPPLPQGSYLLVVSNAHVMEGTRRIEIGYGVDSLGQTVFKKPVVGVCFPTESDVDLAVYFVPVAEPASLDTPSISFAPMSTSTTRPEPGSKVYVIANPEKMTRSIAQGLLSGLRPDLIQFDAPISKGSSGGAVFDEQGRLLGIVFGFLNETGAQNINFAIPADRILPLLKGVGALCYKADQSPDVPSVEEKNAQGMR